MVDINRGFTFSDTDTNGEQTVTVTNINSLVASAAATNFGVAEFLNENDTNKSILVLTESVATGPTTNQSGGTTWYDSANDVVRVAQGSRYDGQFDYISVVNASATVTIAKGSVVRQTSVLTGTYVPKVSMTTTQAWPDALGISLADIAPSGAGVVRKQGLMEMLVSGVVTAGDLLVTSTLATGTLEALTFVSGYPTVTFGLAVAQSFVSLDGVAGPTLVTCMAVL